MDKLLARAREGDGKAEKELFEYLFVRFKALAKRRIGEGEAEDIAQEACLTVLQKYKTETFTKGFEAWAYRILRNKIGNYIQKINKEKDFVRERELEKPKPNPRPEWYVELKRRLIDCLKQIMKRNRLYARVLNPIHQGYKTDEICQRLQIKPNHLYVILNRARRMLRTCLEKGRL